MRVTELAPLRIAFTNIPRRAWAGGYNYQRNLFEALNRYRPGEIAPVLFADPNDDADEITALANVPGVEVHRSAAFDRTGHGLFKAVAFGIDRPAAEQFRACRVDIVFEAARFFGWRLPLPAIAWFPDLQHRMLPELFPASARWRREVGFRIQIASGRMIMLSSESALRDFKTHYHGATNRTCTVRFATQPSSALLSENPTAVAAKYRLPERYFYLPNQFYRHKNHQVVVDALTALQQKGIDVVVCASGSTEDQREPGYFDQVMAQVRSRGLENRFVHLGMIPLSEVYALMRASVALINPSRFEGWSTTVEEAKFFGIPLILSNLEVHREQTANTASYFGTDDPEALADHLVRAFQACTLRVIRNPVPHQQGRVISFADDFVSAVRQAIRSFRR